MSFSIHKRGSDPKVDLSKPFCCVCGRPTEAEELIARKSGLKCSNCIGKKANKKWVQLQQEQVNQLLQHSKRSTIRTSTEENRSSPSEGPSSAPGSAMAIDPDSVMGQYLALQHKPPHGPESRTNGTESWLGSTARESLTLDEADRTVNAIDDDVLVGESSSQVGKSKAGHTASPSPGTARDDVASASNHCPSPSSVQHCADPAASLPPAVTPTPTSLRSNHSQSNGAGPTTPANNGPSSRPSSCRNREEMLTMASATMRNSMPTTAARLPKRRAPAPRPPAKSSMCSTPANAESVESPHACTVRGTTPTAATSDHHGDDEDAAMAQCAQTMPSQGSAAMRASGVTHVLATLDEPTSPSPSSHESFHSTNPPTDADDAGENDDVPPLPPLLCTRFGVSHGDPYASDMYNNTDLGGPRDDDDAPSSAVSSLQRRLARARAGGSRSASATSSRNSARRAGSTKSNSLVGGAKASDRATGLRSQKDGGASARTGDGSGPSVATTATGKASKKANATRAGHRAQPRDGKAGGAGGGDAEENSNPNSPLANTSDYSSEDDVEEDEEEEDGSVSVSGGATPAPELPHVNIDQISVTVMLPSALAAAAEEAAAAAAGGDTAASGAADGQHSRTESMMSGSHRDTSPSERSLPKATAGTAGGKFTVSHARHRRTASSMSSSQPTPRIMPGASGAGATATSARKTGEGVEVKKLSFILMLSDRFTGENLYAVERRFFQDLVPTFEELKRVRGVTLPPIPVKRVPSLRFASEAFTNDRRGECQTFFDAVVTNPFLMRHPVIVALLKLDPFLLNAEQPQSQPHRPASKAGSKASSTKSGGGGGEDVQQTPRPGARRRAGQTKPAAAASPAFLSSQALDKFRRGGEGGGGAAEPFFRVNSHSSIMSTGSSVVRRSRLDNITDEDLARVQVGNLIGRGTFGTVHQGLLQTSCGPQIIAVKKLQLSADADGESLKAVEKELDILRNARHKNIIRFLGSSLSDEKHELSVYTEYVECGTIQSMVSKFGCLPMFAIQKYMTQILKGLQYLHGIGVVHRDIKGENILVTKNGKVKLSDFGCSGSVLETNSESAMPVGSPLWMSPEVIFGSASAPAADIWATGCVGIEMLNRTIWDLDPSLNPFIFMYRIGRSGTPPHGLPTEQELVEAKLSAQPEQYECFGLYRDFLLRCLQLKAEDRWTADQLLKHPFLHAAFPRYLRWMPPASAVASPQ